MSVRSTTGFDVDEFARAYAQWDIDALLDLYADEFELVQIDRDNPPSAPRVRQGMEVRGGWRAPGAAAGVRAPVANPGAGGAPAAATITCEFPGGRKVLANGILEIHNGRIVREHDVLSGDPKSA